MFKQVKQTLFLSLVVLMLIVLALMLIPTAIGMSGYNANFMILGTVVILGSIAIGAVLKHAFAPQQIFVVSADVAIDSPLFSNFGRYSMKLEIETRLKNKRKFEVQNRKSMTIRLRKEDYGNPIEKFMQFIDKQLDDQVASLRAVHPRADVRKNEAYKGLLSDQLALPAATEKNKEVPTLTVEVGSTNAIVQGHQISKGVCQLCGCSQESIEYFKWECKVTA